MPLILLVLISPGSSPRTNLYFYVINPLHKLWEAIVSLLGIVSYQHKPSRINSPCDCEYIPNAHIFCSKTIGHLKGTFSKKSLYHNITCHTRPSTSKGLTVLDEAGCQDYEDGPLSSFWDVCARVLRVSFNVNRRLRFCFFVNTHNSCHPRKRTWLIRSLKLEGFGSQHLLAWGIMVEYDNWLILRHIDS